MQLKYIVYLFLITFFVACTSSKKTYDPLHKFGPEQLQKDFAVYKTVLQQKHPSLYWYSSQQQIDSAWQATETLLKDSLTETQFRRILSRITTLINCGHTVTLPSKKMSKYSDTLKPKSVFPFSVSLLRDTAVVTSRLRQKDSFLTRGTVVTAINKVPIKIITDSLFKYVSSDGYNTTYKYNIFSRPGMFGAYYNAFFNNPDSVLVSYTDSTRTSKNAWVKMMKPDTAAIKQALKTTPPHPDSLFKKTTEKLSKKENREKKRRQQRIIKLDSATGVAIMHLNSFGGKLGLNKFFKKNFAYLNKKNINYLIIDVARNGGGKIKNATTLSRFIANKKFKVGDSVFALPGKTQYGRYIEKNFWGQLFLKLYTKNIGDKRHFRFYEKEFYKPYKKNHYNGQCYILLAGGSFSATTLFAGTVKGQPNVTLIGEETGGGAYGNSAVINPDVTLPETGVRLHIPYFRLVVKKDAINYGRGIFPEVVVSNTVASIKKGIDPRIEKAMQLIEAHKNTVNNNLK